MFAFGAVFSSFFDEHASAEKAIIAINVMLKSRFIVTKVRKKVIISHFLVKYRAIFG